MYVETKNSQYQIILIWELTGVKEEKRYRYRIASMGGTFPKGSYWEGNTSFSLPMGRWSCYKMRRYLEPLLCMLYRLQAPAVCRTPTAGQFYFDFKIFFVKMI
jgi:hypothetical protein